MLFDDEDLEAVEKPSKRPANLKKLVYAKKQRYILTRAEVLQLPVGTEVTCDTEQFKNYQLIAFKVVGWNGYFYFERQTGPIDKPFLRLVLCKLKIITFNGIKYDLPIIEAALGVNEIEDTVEACKQISDAIILRQETMDWTYKPNPYNHIDLIEVTPLKGSLKLYGARLHAERIQEMPVDPHKLLTPEEIEETREYCFNDLDVTELVYEELREQIAMREAIGATVNKDIRSKSDAQIAEIVIAEEFKAQTGFSPHKPKEISYKPVNYKPPAYLCFQTKLLNEALKTIIGTDFPILPSGYLKAPPEVVGDEDSNGGLLLTIGNNTFQMSLGGLHSSETNLTLRAGNMWAISDFDVASYYPKIILNGGIAPPSMGEPFLLIYNGIVVRRLSAKEAKRMIESDGLKITINGTFGKLGNPFSIMYSPELMLYVTLTGQLTLLLMIEDAALHNFEIVSANTDGVVFRYEHDREAELQAIVKRWEQQTNFKMEKTSYDGYFARDVNNYMTLKKNGEWKLKGAYSEKGSAQNSVLSRNPQTFICVDAVKAYIAHSIPIEVTIRNCSDIRRFVSIKNVKGGGHKGGYYLGKVVRWYYAEGINGGIHSCLTGNQVADTEGGKPLMQLGDFPEDIDYNWYINKSFDILKDIGYFGRNEQRRLF